LALPNRGRSRRSNPPVAVQGSMRDCLRRQADVNIPRRTVPHPSGDGGHSRTTNGSRFGDSGVVGIALIPLRKWQLWRARALTTPLGLGLRRVWLLRAATGWAPRIAMALPMLLLCGAS